VAGRCFSASLPSQGGNHLAEPRIRRQQCFARPVFVIRIVEAGGHGRTEESPLAAGREPRPLPHILRRDQLRPPAPLNGGKGAVQYRRVLPPEVFFTNWSYVDHVLLPPGTSVGAHKHMGVEEIYYVMDGEGTVKVNDETAPVKKVRRALRASGVKVVEIDDQGRINLSLKDVKK